MFKTEKKIFYADLLHTKAATLITQHVNAEERQLVLLSPYPDHMAG